MSVFYKKFKHNFKKYTMRKLIILTAIVFIAVSGCKQIDKLTQFTMKYDETVTVPSNIGINLPFNILSPPITTNSETEFSVNNTHKDLIEEIRLTKLNLSITAPTGADFSFLKSIRIYISADGLDEIEIAWLDNVPADAGSEIALETANDDIKEYIKKDSFSLRLNTVTDEILTSDYQINIHSEFFVDAKILGQ